MKYIIRINAKEEAVKSVEDLENILDRTKHLESSDLCLRQSLGEMKGFERFVYKKVFGLCTEIRGKSILVLSKGNKAVVTFLNEDFEGPSVTNPEYDGPIDARIKFDFEGGYSLEYEKDCISQDLAFRAVVYFYKYGHKPDWLAYRRYRDK